MRKFIVGGILLILTGVAAHAQDYGDDGYDAPPPPYGYQAPPPPYGYEAPAPRYRYEAPPPRYGYQAPPVYGYGPPRHCRVVYTNYGPRRICPRYVY